MNSVEIRADHEDLSYDPEALSLCRIVVLLGGYQCSSEVTNWANCSIFFPLLEYAADLLVARIGVYDLLQTSVRQREDGWRGYLALQFAEGAELGVVQRLELRVLQLPELLC